MKTKKTFLFLLLALTSGLLFSQGNTDKTSVFHVGFFPPLSTHGPKAKEYTNSVSINFLAGISENEKVFTFGGLTNIVLNDASGFQFAGINNYIGNNGSGIVFGGIINMTGNKYNGFQFAGVGNIAKDITGFQFGGIFNKARNVKGVQFAGLVNIAENSDYPIGLINIIKNGKMGIGVSYNELGTISTGFRSGGRVLYGILGAAFNPDIHDKFGFEGGFGAHINIVSRFKIDLELKQTGFDMFSKNNFMHSSFSIIPAFSLLPCLEVFAGGSYNYLQTDNLKNRKAFPNHHTWRKFTDSKLRQYNFGYVVGTQFVF